MTPATLYARTYWDACHAVRNGYRRHPVTTCPPAYLSLEDACSALVDVCRNAPPFIAERALTARWALANEYGRKTA